MSDDPLSQLRVLAPLRDLPGEERERLGIVRCGRSRPRKIEPAPERDPGRRGRPRKKGSKLPKLSAVLAGLSIAFTCAGIDSGNRIAIKVTSFNRQPEALGVAKL